MKCEGIIMSKLVPIPGYTHLHRLQPPQRARVPALPHSNTKEATALVAIALATYFGVRPPGRLQKRAFSPTLIERLSAGKDSNLQPRPVRGPTQLLSAHTHASNGSLRLSGTVVCANRCFGYFARFDSSFQRLILTSLEVAT